MEIPSEIKEAFAQRVGLTHPDAPVYYAWVFDARDARVHLSDDHEKPRRDKDHHDGLAKKVNHHPGRVHGYAYRIRGGWRITDVEHKAVDHFVAKQVVKSIEDHESSGTRATATT